MYDAWSVMAMVFGLAAKFALVVITLFWCKVRVTDVATPTRTSTETGVAIQLPAPLMLLQATVKASAAMVYEEPGRTGPTWRLVEAVPDTTVKVFTMVVPDEGVAEMRMH
jgi:hypothetical protein